MNVWETTLFSILFGSTLKINDLLSEHGYKWFKGGFLLISLFTAISMILLFENLSNISRTFWLIVILSWVLRGKIDCLHHGIPISLSLVYFFITKSFLFNEFLIPFLFFFSLLGIIHDLIQEKKVRLGKKIKTFLYDHQWSYWIILMIFYEHLNGYDLNLIFSVISFIIAYDFFYSNMSKRILRMIGIKNK